MSAERFAGVRDGILQASAFEITDAAGLEAPSASPGLLIIIAIDSYCLGVETISVGLKVRDANGQSLAYVYFTRESERRSLCQGPYRG